MGEGVGVGWPGVKVCAGMDCETVDPLMKKDKLTPLHVQLALVCYVCMSVACNVCMSVACNVCMSVACNVCMSVACNVCMSVACNVCMSVACFRLSGRVDYIQF